MRESSGMQRKVRQAFSEETVGARPCRGAYLSRVAATGLESATLSLGSRWPTPSVLINLAQRQVALDHVGEGRAGPRKFWHLNRVDHGRALGWHFATRLLPELWPTVVKGGKGWQDGRVNLYLLAGRDRAW